MRKFLLGVVLGASVVGVGAWATERNLGVVADGMLEISTPAATMPMAECMYYKDGLWNRLTPESMK